MLLIGLAAQPIVKLDSETCNHQYEISVLVFQTSFSEESFGGIAKSLL